MTKEIEARAKDIVTRMDALRAPDARPTQDEPGEYEALEWELVPLVNALIDEPSYGNRPHTEYNRAYAAEVERLRSL